MLSESNPYVRSLLRFVLLPWCYATKIDWPECSKSSIQVWKDLLHIFFRLRYYPDNYGPCRLWEKPRNEWLSYYGSSYNPWARHALRQSVQRFEHVEFFVDKARCEEHFRNHAIPMPRLLGVISPGADLSRSLMTMIAKNCDHPVIVKPVRGARGRGVHIASVHDRRVRLRNSAGACDLSSLKLSEPYLVEDCLRQHECISRIFPNAVNTIRVVVLLTADGEPMLIGSYMRFGTGTSIVDNVNQGGVSVGIDQDRGIFLKYAYDSRGRRYERHPDTGFTFEGFKVPLWDEVVGVSRRTQLACPFYKLIGLDVALTGQAPVVIEVNANPDIVGLEQKCGPLLKNRRTLAEFARYQLLFNRYQRNLAAAATQECTSPGVDSLVVH